MSRVVDKKILSQEQKEGMGMTVRRSIGRPELRNFDPFLLLDEFKSPNPKNGAPDHPHRGFETVTYIVEGSSQHEDCCGHKGILNKGDFQWMTAGRGIVHSEMPYGDGPGHGLQLWVNLSKAEKMCEPAYQELKDEDVARATSKGIETKVIAGESMGVKSPVYTRTPTMYLVFKMEPNSSHSQAVPLGWSLFSYVLSGTAHFGPPGNQTSAEIHHTVTFTDGTTLHMENKGPECCHFVLIGGQPLNEPIVQHGPFVMNTQEEIKQALSDYSHCKNGFESADGWRSAVATELGIF